MPRVAPAVILIFATPHQIAQASPARRWSRARRAAAVVWSAQEARPEARGVQRQVVSVQQSIRVEMAEIRQIKTAAPAAAARRAHSETVVMVVTQQPPEQRAVLVEVEPIAAPVGRQRSMKRLAPAATTEIQLVADLLVAAMAPMEEEEEEEMRQRPRAAPGVLARNGTLHMAQEEEEAAVGEKMGYQAVRAAQQAITAEAERGAEVRLPSVALQEVAEQEVLSSSPTCPRKRPSRSPAM